MDLKFNIDRPKVSDEEIRKNQDFEKLVQKFKEQSIKQARGDESWWKNKSIKYTAIIAGVTVICTVTYFSLFREQKQISSHDKINTPKTISTQKTKLASTNKSTTALHPPVKRQSPPYSAYQINNAKGGVIKHHNSRIVIPAGSFVNLRGEQLRGDVTIEYREMHSTADIITSGISMAYDSAGHPYQLETAGMFEIRGNQDQKAVFVAPGKSLEVQLASQRDEQKFNQYIYDTIARNWIYQKKDRAIPVSQLHNNSGQETEAKIQKLSHVANVVIPKAVDSVGVVYLKKTEKLPSLKAPSPPRSSAAAKATFKLDGSYDEFPELSGFNDVLFEVGPENKNYTKEFHEITWSDIKIAPGPNKGINYILSLSHRNRVEKLVVYPVLWGKDLDKAKAQYETKLNEYEKALEKRKSTERLLMAELESKQKAYLEEQKKIQNQIEAERKKLREQLSESVNIASNQNASASQAVKATRIFRISQFGIFNSDCPHNVPKGKTVQPLFVGGTGKHPIRPGFVYLIDHTNKTVFDLSAENGFQFKYDADSEYSLCVFQKDQVFICDRKEFEKTTSNNSRSFETLELPEGADNYAEFRKKLEL